MIKKVLRQDRDISYRLIYANKKERYIILWLIQHVFQQIKWLKNEKKLRGKTKLKYYKNISNYYDSMNIRMDGDPSAKNARSVGKIDHEVLILMKILQTEPKVKKTNIKYYDLYYTVIKTRDEKEIVNDKYNNNESDYINFDDFIIYIHNRSIKHQQTIFE